MLLRLVSLDGSYIEVRANQPMWKHNEYHQYAGLCSKLLTKLKAAFPRILTNNMSWVPAIFFSQLLQLVIAIHSINQSIEHIGPVFGCIFIKYIFDPSVMAGYIITMSLQHVQTVCKTNIHSCCCISALSRDNFLSY